jgi:hypothetical protein
LVGNVIALRYQYGAAYQGDVAAVTALLENENAPVSALNHETVLTMTSVELLEVLFSHNYDTNHSGLSNTNDRDRTLIGYPAVLKRDNVVHWLVEHGAHPAKGNLPSDRYDKRVALFLLHEFGDFLVGANY